RWRLYRDGLRRRVPLAGNIAFCDLLLDNVVDGLSGGAIKDEHESQLAALCERGNRSAVFNNVKEHGCRRKIIVPEIVANCLEVPDAFAGFHIDRNQRVGKQVIARPLSTVVVGGWSADRR